MISHLFCNGPALYIKKFRLLFVQKSLLSFFFAKSWLLFVQKSPLSFFIAKQVFRTKYGILIASKNHIQ